MNQQIDIAAHAWLLGTERLVAEPREQRIAEKRMLAPGRRDDRGRDAREKPIVVLAFGVLVVRWDMCVTWGRGMAVIYVLPGADVGEGKVVRREANDGTV